MFVDYVFAKDEQLPPMPEGLLYRYVVGANGVFVQAKRTGLDVMLWSSALVEPIRGLAALQPYLRLGAGRVPKNIVTMLFEIARKEAPREALFYLSTSNPSRLSKLLGTPHLPYWWATVPQQAASITSVRPLDPFDDSARNALIEAHSHHTMGAFFSKTDDRDEQGFRLYAVLGRIFEKPSLAARIGIYGHFWEVPADWIFELPGGVHDALEVELEVLSDYSNSQF